MHNDSSSHGFFSWNELLTSDLEAAKKFYGDLLGWTFKESKTIYGDTYLTAFKDGRMAAGMMIKPADTPDHIKGCWDPYITADDVEAAAEQVEETGGKVMLPPTKIEGVGRFCVIQDPQGIYLNLITYDQED
ncbi:VOC family protein [Maridesulfovibrio salexigens]|uniref:Glyoxalase/bleomycin resistance protein/dioxygenase n=1 Tax=Maridesulfovibrio salexigens (strain ATCC 14822 / DSM 2638 / NCIMB 8403 / VKM B-1763) TaxID=526222 RepID=C6C1Y6_MARSD|nr:VOC family protein [Maridesulfovibrio salexigens]ACS79382.1 Glyoxalase/bleomycin resistance protein/dioxygenase [Maridesulfovibrio salexigens DSM 2638]